MEPPLWIGENSTFIRVRVFRTYASTKIKMNTARDIFLTKKIYLHFQSKELAPLRSQIYIYEKIWGIYI